MFKSIYLLLKLCLLIDIFSVLQEVFDIHLPSSCQEHKRIQKLVFCQEHEKVVNFFLNLEELLNQWREGEEMPPRPCSETLPVPPPMSRSKQEPDLAPLTCIQNMAQEYSSPFSTVRILNSFFSITLPIRISLSW